jgi:hypothetical protein
MENAALTRNSNNQPQSINRPKKRHSPTTMRQKPHTLRQRSNQLPINQPRNTHAQKSPIRSNNPIELSILTLPNEVRPVIRSRADELPETREALPCLVGTAPRQLFENGTQEGKGRISPISGRFHTGQSCLGGESSVWRT